MIAFWIVNFLQVETWKGLRRRLMDGGRIIVNLSRDDSGVARTAIEDAFEGGKICGSICLFQLNACELG